MIETYPGVFAREKIGLGNVTLFCWQIYLFKINKVFFALPLVVGSDSF